MPVDVTATNTALRRQAQSVTEFAGLTSGNGRIVNVPDNCVGILVSAFPTSAGTASVKASLSPTTPTDFTNFGTTAVGAVTAATVQELPGGLKWVGLDPASGTWTFRVRFQIDFDVL